MQNHTIDHSGANGKQKEYEYLLKIPSVIYSLPLNARFTWLPGIYVWMHVLELVGKYCQLRKDIEQSVIIAQLNGNQVCFFLDVVSKTKETLHIYLENENDTYEINLFPKDFQEILKEKGQIIMKRNPHVDKNN